MKNIISVILLSFLLLAGCVEIQASRRVVDRPISITETRKATSGWKYKTKVSAYDNRDSTFSVCVELFQYKDCTVTEHRIVDRTVHVTRTGPDMARWYLTSGGLALASGAASVGVVTVEQMREQSNEYLAGGVLAFTAALGFLAYAIVNEIRATDSVNHVGQVNDDTSREGKCWGEPISGMPLELKAPNGRLLLKGTTDASGLLQVKVEADELFNLGPGDYRILIAGREIAQTKALAKVYASVLQEREEKRQQAALAEQEREREARRQQAARRREWEQGEEIRLRGEANRIRHARNAVKVWDVALLHRSNGLNSKVLLSLNFENLTYRNVIGVATHVRILNSFGRAALTRTFENEVVLPARKGIQESVRIENNSAWPFEELSLSPDYRHLWKIAENGTAEIEVRVLKVIFEDRTILK